MWGVGPTPGVSSLPDPRSTAAGTRQSCAVWPPGPSALPRRHRPSASPPPASLPQAPRGCRGSLTFCSVWSPAPVRTASTRPSPPPAPALEGQGRAPRLPLTLDGLAPGQPLQVGSHFRCGQRGEEGDTDQGQGARRVLVCKTGGHPRSTVTEGPKTPYTQRTRGPTPPAQQPAPHGAAAPPGRAAPGAPWAVAGRRSALSLTPLSCSVPSLCTSAHGRRSGKLVCWALPPRGTPNTDDLAGPAAERPGPSLTRWLLPGRAGAPMALLAGARPPPSGTGHRRRWGTGTREGDSAASHGGVGCCVVTSASDHSHSPSPSSSRPRSALPSLLGRLSPARSDLSITRSLLSKDRSLGESRG